MSTPVAAVTALGGALVFGISAVADQRSTKRVQARRALSPGILLDLVRQPLWLTAITANVVGFALQVVALSLGSIAVVQPLLVFDMVFSVLISWFLARRAGTQLGGGRRSTVLIFTGVGAATAGVAGFLFIGQPSAGHTDVGFAVLFPLAIGLVVVGGGCLVLAAKSQTLGPLALALACGLCYGVAAFSVKLVTSEFGAGPASVFTNWPIYVLAVVGPAGFILNQDAFQQGRLLAPVQAIITTTDPIISIALGVLWLGVVLRDNPAELFGEALSLAVMIVGIVLIAHQAPPVASDGSRSQQKPGHEPAEASRPRRPD